MGLPKAAWIARTRRNHALEHATIHILNSRYPITRLIGWSTPHGFYIHGDVPSPAVEAAANEAVSRLKHGESHLAIHPRCGTNLVTAGVLAGLAAFVAMLPGGNRSRRERLPLVILVSTLALMLAQPLGVSVQRHVTTDARHSEIAILSVERQQANNNTLHIIRTTHGA
jgi:hypothetical protein